MKVRRFGWIMTLGRPWVLVVLLCLLFFARSYFSVDPDFGWHLSSGEYILTHGVPAHDIYTYTASDFPWIHHEWLADVIQSLVYRLGSGYIGLAILHTLMWVAAFLLVMRAHRSKLRFVTLWGALAVLSFAGVRALSWSVLFSAVLYYLVSQAHRPIMRVLIPLLMLVWANIHGSFVLGLVYLVWQFGTTRSAEWLRVLLLSTLMTCITPYGPFMYIEVFRTVSDVSLTSTISEWKPFGIGIEASVFVGAWVASLLLTSSKRITRFLRFDSALLLAAFVSSRHLPLFVIYALGGTLVRFGEIARNVYFARPLPTFARVAVVVGVVGIGALSLWSVAASSSLNPEARWPTAIARELNSHPCNGHVFNEYNIGGYLIWKAPNTPVYIDGRMPSWSQGNVKYMDTYRRVITDAKVRAAEFARYNIHCVVWSDNTELSRALQHEDWHSVLVDAGYVLLKKN